MCHNKPITGYDQAIPKVPPSALAVGSLPIIALHPARIAAQIIAAGIAMTHHAKNRLEGISLTQRWSQRGLRRSLFASVFIEFVCRWPRGSAFGR